MAASATKYCEKGAVNKSAASAASPDSVKFQQVIKSAASAASRKPKSREGSSRGVQDSGSAGRRQPRGTPTGASFPGFGLPGGCASSRLDHGLQFCVIRGGCASSRLIHGFSDCATEPFSSALNRLEDHALQETYKSLSPQNLTSCIGW